MGLLVYCGQRVVNSAICLDHSGAAMWWNTQKVYELSIAKHSKPHSKYAEKLESFRSLVIVLCSIWSVIKTLSEIFKAGPLFSWRVQRTVCVKSRHSSSPVRSMTAKRKSVQLINAASVSDKAATQCWVIPITRADADKRAPDNTVCKQARQEKRKRTLGCHYAQFFSSGLNWGYYF